MNKFKIRELTTVCVWGGGDFTGDLNFLLHNRFFKNYRVLLMSTNIVLCKIRLVMFHIKKKLLRYIKLLYLKKIEKQSTLRLNIQ